MQHLEPSLAPHEVVREQLRHRNLVLRGLCQRHADRIADAVGQQGTYADSALDPPLQPVAGLGHPEVDRKGHPLALHRFDQQPVGGHHHARIARLHGDDRLIELPRLADAQELHRGGHHPLGGVAPLVEDPPGQRPVVHPDPERHAPLAALLDQPLQVAPVQPVVARVDPHLVDIFRRHGRHLGQEVDIGHDSRPIAVTAQPPDDVFQVLALAHPLGRQAHDPAARPVDPLDLGHAGLRILRVGVGHRLHGHGLPAADHDLSDPYPVTLPPPVLRQIHCKKFFRSDKSRKNFTTPNRNPPSGDANCR